MGRKLIYTQFFIILLSSGIEQYLSLSWAKYLSDIINICIFINLLTINRNIKKSLSIIKIPLLCYTGLFIVGFSGFLREDYSWGQYLWEVRTLFRYLIFFISCIVFLNLKDIEKLTKYLTYFYVANFIISLFQYYILGIYWDYLGGIFGYKGGTNGFTIILTIIIITTQINNYIDKKTTKSEIFFFIFSSFWISLYAELKYLFFLTPLITLLLVLFKKKNKRSILLITAIISGILIIMSSYMFIYNEEFFSTEAISDYSNNAYGKEEDSINRTTAFMVIEKFFLDTDIDKYFGKGMGYASNSSFATNGFYDKYEYTHYDWFSHSYMFLENGRIGFICYLLFFISLFIIVYRNKIIYTNKDYRTITLTLLFSTLCLLIYNSSMRLDMAYMMYLYYSIPFIILLKKNKQRNA